jgi:hypothetical protein
VYNARHMTTMQCSKFIYKERDPESPLMTLATTPPKWAIHVARVRCDVRAHLTETFETTNPIVL